MNRNYFQSLEQETLVMVCDIVAEMFSHKWWMASILISLRYFWINPAPWTNWSLLCWKRFHDHCGE